MVELVAQQPAKPCVAGSIPAGRAAPPRCAAGVDVGPNQSGRFRLLRGYIYIYIYIYIISGVDVGPKPSGRLHGIRWATPSFGPPGGAARRAKRGMVSYHIILYYTFTRII